MNAARGTQRDRESLPIRALAAALAVGAVLVIAAVLLLPDDAAAVAVLTIALLTTAAMVHALNASWRR
jgi:hypothetical protein